MKSVLAYGEILWDLLPNGKVLGGAPFNFAYRFFESGGDVAIASRLGCDDLGGHAFGVIENFGLDTSLIQRDDVKATGTVPVILDENGVPDFTIIPDVAYDFIEPVPELLSRAASADCICFGTLVQRTARSRNTLAALFEASPDSLKFLDINLRRDCFSRETVTSSLESADILKLNEDEVYAVTSLLGLKQIEFFSICEFLIDRYGLDVCLVTLGADGVMAMDSLGGRRYIPGWRIEVVDTVGSGDAFSAGFLHSWLGGTGLTASCEHGNRLGAAAAMTAGGTGAVSNALMDSVNETGYQRAVNETFVEYWI